MTDFTRRLDPESLLAEVDWARRLARALVGSAHGDDVAQEALRIALERRPSVEPGAGLRAWLGGVISNLAGKQRERGRSADFHQRRVARGVRVDGDRADIERVELQRRLADAVLALAEPYRSAIVLRYFDDLDPRAIAERQGISYEAARQRISRGVAQLRARLEREDARHERPWSALAIALARSDGGQPLALGTGGIVMGVKVKIAVCVLIAALGGVALWRASTETGSTSPGTATRAEVRSADLARPSTSRELDDALLPSARNAHPALAAAPDTTAVPVIDRDRDLHGVVVDSRGVPVANAAIEVRRNVQREYETLDLVRMYASELVANARTRTDGTFAVPLEPGRAYDLDVTARGHAPSSFSPCHAGERVRIELALGAVLSGRITRRADATPVADCVVEIPQRPDASGRVAGVPRSVLTDADGRYRFADVTQAEYWLQLRPRADAAPLWRKIDVHAGEQLVEDVVVDPGHTLRGRVLDASTGAPIADAEVGEGWMFKRSVRTDAEGRFTFVGFATEGSYSLAARARGYGGHSVTVREPKGPFPDSVEVQLKTARALTGRVVDDASHPIADAYVAAVGYEWGELGGGRHDWLSVRTDADGRFRIESLTPDLSHALVVRKDGHATWQRQLPRRELTTPELDVGDVVLARPATIRGVVIDDQGEPIARQVVELSGFGADYRAWEPAQEEGPETHASSVDTYLKARVTRADDLGRFTFAGVAAGKYEVGALLANGRSSKGPTIDVPAAGDVRDLRLVVPRGFPIAGRAVDAEGVGLRAYVQVRNADTRRSTRTQSRADGAFEVPGLEDGSYDVTVEPEDLWRSGPDAVRHAPATVAGVRGGTSGLEVVVSVASELRGRVTDTAGAPVANATVEARGIDVTSSLAALSNARGEFMLWAARDARYELVVTTSYPIPREVRVPSVKAGGEPIEVRLP